MELHMYQDYYQLKENPFNLTADPYFFYASASHGNVYSNLLYGIEHRKGIIVITGEVGTGKTTLCRKLVRQIHKKLKFALILNPNFSEIELLRLIVNDLGVRTKSQDKFVLMSLLNKFLLKMSKKGYNVVVVIDEAQNLNISQLEQIRLLSNLETEKEKLLQIILVGQPELNITLQSTALRQLTQRVSVFCKLNLLTHHDVKTYIEYRISQAFKKPNVARNIFFTEKAIAAIYRLTKGSPRSINVLCDRALLAGFVAETHIIDEWIIEQCAKEIMYCEHHI